MNKYNQGSANRKERKNENKNEKKVGNNERDKKER